ncbi:MAG: glycosyltransferase [Candidatus Thorarchaeota archaeon]|jgi:glycosyltransferase involved in cell wall biosynthesis/predicted flap endonuclease-1-like 5' DNA nuclease
MISIIIPTFNDQDVLPRAVNSALSQVYKDKEIIVVDDGSDEPVVNTFGSSVKLIRHSCNAGLSAALNTGIEHSRGDRFVILASDDELRRDHLAKTSAVDADVVSCNMLVNGKPVSSKSGTLKDLIKGNCHSYAALVKKWVWRATGGFKEAMNPSWEDYEFWLNSAKVGAKWGHVNAPLHIYHRNPTGRDASAQGKDALLWGRLQGYHQDLYGTGMGVVSFVIPCYMHEEYVAGAVASVLNQDYPHVNVVVVDDGSPGDVAKALEEVADDRVTLIRQDNRHLSGARNTGIYYALQKFGSEYLIMLDADDAIHPSYVDVTMGNIRKTKEYVYTDVKFIGDAFHSIEMENYACPKIIKKHLHPCTFLQPSAMWQDIVGHRGYGYDEVMKKGYEDWEYALAAVTAGWCGKRVPGHYFYYRFHQNGSMRTSAKEIHSEITSYIRGKHPWMGSKAEVDDMCRTCGGRGRFTMASATKGGMGSVFVPGVGEVAPTDTLMVVYSGSTTSTITKQGAGGRIYKFSGDPTKQAKGYGPQFIIYARDAHLFVGPFNISRVAAEQQAPAAPRRVEVVQVQRKPGPVQQPTVVEVPVKKQAIAVSMDALPKDMPIEAALEVSGAGVDYKPDDFTQIKGIGPASAQKLVDAGITMFDDLADAPLDEISAILRVSKSRATAIRRIADEKADELAIAEGTE